MQQTDWMMPTLLHDSTRAHERAMTSSRLVFVTLLAALVAGLFRFLSHAQLPNDHYVDLSLAQALLLGDRPVRDYTDVGSPLMVALSAGAQLLIGRELLSEVILTVTALSIAAAATCWAAGRLTGSSMLGFLAAFLQVAAFPRLYDYPKFLVYPILFLIGWAYVRRPTVARLVGLGAWTAFAFLLRHDHGVYSAIGGGAALLIAHWPAGARRVLVRGATYALITLLWASPYLVYVQRQIGLIAYFRTSIAVSRADAGRADWILPVLTPIRQGPLVVMRPRAADDLPAINVRWRSGLSDTGRLGHERALGLLYPELRGDGESWRYRVNPPATQTLVELMDMRDVADTSGFDRRSFEFEISPPMSRRILMAWNLDRIVLGPPLEDVFNDANMTTVSFYALYGLPVATIVLWLLRRNSDPWPLRCGPEVLLLAAVAIPTVIGFVRSPSQGRVPDGFGVAPMLAAWVIAAVVTARPRFALVRAILKTAAVTAGVIFFVAVASMTSLREKIDNGRLREPPSVIMERARGVVAQSSRWPWVGEWPTGGGAELAPYLNRCTTADDRILVLWNAPEFNVFSRRAFAGGEVVLIPAFRPTESYEPAVLARLQRQHVPIILADLAITPDFDAAYPRVSAYLADRYREARVFSYESGQRIALFVDRERPQRGLDRTFNLPCFAP